MKAYAAPPVAIPWLLRRVGCSYTAEFRAIMAVKDDGEIAGMVGYDLWTETSCVMHIALENPAAFRTLLVPAFEYPFVQGGKKVVLAMVRGDNEKSRRLCDHVGFREVYRVRDGIEAGVDMVLYEMRREECRWIGQKLRRAA